MLVAAVSPLLFLLVLACPIGMALMMLFMGRGMRMGRSQGRGALGKERSLADLEAEQARIGERIDALATSEEPQREPAGAR